MSDSGKKKKSLISWIFEFAAEKKWQYFASIFFALLSVSCSILPYLMIAKIVGQLLQGERDWNLFLREAGRSPGIFPR